MTSHLSILLGAGAFVACPAFFHDLPATAYRQRFRGNVFCDAGSRANITAFAKFHRRDQGRVAAHENAIFDYGFKFVDPIVVAGDGSSADVYTLADFGVTQVR